MVIRAAVEQIDIHLLSGSSVFYSQNTSSHQINLKRNTPPILMQRLRML